MAKKKKVTEPIQQISDDTKKKEALNQALKKIEKDFGKGSIMRLGDTASQDVDVISTSSIGLDKALGIGGIPRGRITEIYGPESSGKTTVALHIVSQAQKNNGYAAFIDAEHALDPIYAQNLGVDIDNLIISQPDTGEQALEILEELVRSGALDVIVIDSVAALVPKAEIDGEMGDSHVGLHARLMSQALRKLTAVIKKSNTAVIFINQLREKVGISFGNPEVTTGGRALKFYSSIRLDIRKGETIKKDSEFIGNRTRARVVKNKMAPPFKFADFDIIYGTGISILGELIDIAAEEDIVDKAGSWYSYNETRLGQGKEKAKLFLEENPETADEIRQKVLEKLNLIPKTDETEEEEDQVDMLSDDAASDNKETDSDSDNDNAEIDDDDDFDLGKIDF